MITPWSLVHTIACGVLYGILTLIFRNRLSFAKKFIIIFILGDLYELKDYYIAYISKTTDSRSIANCFGDLVFNSLGVIIAYYIFNPNDPKLKKKYLLV